jgi:ABC-type uncharacterized transport system fused permease/ATPase subunit
VNKFTSTMQEALLLYTAVVIVGALAFFVGQLLSVHWRKRITDALHARYFSGNTFFHVQSLPQPVTEPTFHDMSHERLLTPCDVSTFPEQASSDVTCRDGADDERLIQDSAHSDGQSGYTARPDNPDQRMTQDVANFTAALELFVRSASKTPLNLALYSYLSVKLFKSILPLASAVAFFLLCAVAHRVVVSAMASAIYVHQRKEGDFRAAHMRVCTNAVPIAAWNAARVEERHVQEMLGCALRAQYRVVYCYAAQKLIAQVRALNFAPSTCFLLVSILATQVVFRSVALPCGFPCRLATTTVFLLTILL